MCPLSNIFEATCLQQGGYVFGHRFICLFARILKKSCGHFDENFLILHFNKLVYIPTVARYGTNKVYVEFHLSIYNSLICVHHYYYLILA